jgi:hypothetical protein
MQTCPEAGCSDLALDVVNVQAKLRGPDVDLSTHIDLGLATQLRRAVGFRPLKGRALEGGRVTH